MARTIQARLTDEPKKLLQKLKRIIQEYLDKLVELEKEYLRISKWKFLKRIRNKHKRENLTRNFKRQMFELGVLV